MRGVVTRKKMECHSIGCRGTGFAKEARFLTLLAKQDATDVENPEMLIAENFFGLCITDLIFLLFPCLILTFL